MTNERENWQFSGIVVALKLAKTDVEAYSAQVQDHPPAFFILPNFFRKQSCPSSQSWAGRRTSEKSNSPPALIRWEHHLNFSTHSYCWGIGNLKFEKFYFLDKISFLFDKTIGIAILIKAISWRIQNNLLIVFVFISTLFTIRHFYWRIM